MEVTEKIKKIIEPTATQMGYELVRLSFQGDDANKTLQIMAERIDRKNMQADDCQKLSRALSAVLDVEDPIAHKYLLEVTSPGIDRPLVKIEDYDRFRGNEAKVETLTPIDGRKRFRGNVLGTSGDDIKILFEGNEIAIPFSQIAKAKLVLTDELVASLLKKHS